MGFDGTFVIAQWDRPLTELAINQRLTPANARTPDDSVSWTRGDGWQCYAPMGAYYDRGELLPPVAEIAAETGGLVLGAGVARSDHYRMNFLDGDQLRSIAVGGYEDTSATAIRKEMINRWGEPWQDRAAVSLRNWARPFTDASFIGIYYALAVPQLFAERTFLDILVLLTLTPEQPYDGWAMDAWWQHDIPECEYAIRVGDIGYLDLRQPYEDFRNPELALAFTAAGPGIWSLHDARWEVPPSSRQRDLIEEVHDQLRRRGWQDPRHTPADPATPTDRSDRS